MPDEVDPGSRDLGSRDHLANLLERLLLLAIPVRVDATLCAPDESGSRVQAVTRCACGRTHNPIRLRVGVAGETLFRTRFVARQPWPYTSCTTTSGGYIGRYA